MTAIDTVARYLAGLDDSAEEQLFEDPQLASAAAWVMELREGLKQVAAVGPPVPVLTPSELAALRRSRAVVVLEPGSSPADTVLAPEVELVAGRLPIALGDARSIDVEFGSARGPTHFRVHEAPFDPGSNVVIVLCSRHVALAAGDIRVSVRDERGALRGEFVLPALTAAR
jgi:hypothetical protein